MKLAIICCLILLLLPAAPAWTPTEPRVDDTARYGNSSEDDGESNYYLQVTRQGLFADHAGNLHGGFAIQTGGINSSRTTTIALEAKSHQLIHTSVGSNGSVGNRLDQETQIYAEVTHWNSISRHCWITPLPVQELHVGSEIPWPCGGTAKVDKISADDSAIRLQTPDGVAEYQLEIPYPTSFQNKTVAKSMTHWTPGAKPIEPALEQPMIWRTPEKIPIDDSFNPGFSLEQAIEIAKNDIRSGFGSLWAQEETYLAAASHTRERASEMSDELFETWDLTATNGESTVQVMVQETGPIPTGAWSEVHSILRQTDRVDDQRIYPKKIDLPDTIPDLGQLHKIWNAYSEDDGLRFGFSLACENPCEKPQFRAYFGNTTGALLPTTPTRAEALVWSHGGMKSILAFVATKEILPGGTSQSSTPFPDDPFEPGGFLVVPLVASFVSIIAFFLFSRVRKSSVLDNQVRASIFAEIQNNPGAHASDLVRKIGIGKGSLDHHVGILMQHNMVHESSENGYRCFYTKPTGGIGQAYAKSPIAQRIVQELAKESQTSASLARNIGCSASSITYHRRKLAQAGILEERENRLHATPRGLRISNQINDVEAACNNG